MDEEDCYFQLPLKSHLSLLDIQSQEPLGLEACFNVLCFDERPLPLILSTKCHGALHISHESLQFVGWHHSMGVRCSPQTQRYRWLALLPLHPEFADFKATALTVVPPLQSCTGHHNV